jgi:hypothetical protein
MAREHARILTRIWRDDDDWRDLPWEGQHMYFLLLSQPTLTHAGTLSLTLNRWSRLTKHRTAQDIEKAVRLLEERRFVVVDWDTEELLIRSFIRNDGVHRQPNVLKAAWRVITEELESKRLKEVIAEELRRVGLTEYADRLSPSANPSGNPSPNPPGGMPEPHDDPSAATPNGKGSANPSGRVPRETRGRGEGGVVSSSPVVGSVGRPAQKRGTRIPNDFTVTPAMVEWARHECPNVDGRRETEKFTDHFQAAPGAKGVKLDWTATWRNWMRRAEESAAARPSHLRAVPTQTLPADPAAAFDDLRRRADAQEAARLIHALWIEPPQPPSDKTPPQQWTRQRAVEFIDAHERELRAALTERKTG